MEQLQQKAKSFWERPEGTVGMVFGVAIVAVVGGILYRLLPYIITLLENTLYTVALGVGLFALIYVLFIDGRTRTLAWYMYKSLMRFITGIFIEIDPIGILKSYVEELKGSLGKMNQQISNLRQQMGSLKKSMQENQAMFEKNMKIAEAAKKDGNLTQVRLKSRKAGRLKDSNMTLDALYKKMEVVYRILTKMYENSQVLIEDIEHEVDVKSRERKAITATHSAFKSAMRIINGDPDKKAMFDQTMEYLADDYGRKVGEIEHFMATSQSFIEGIDLQNGVFEEEGLAMLEQWEKDSTCLILGEDCKRELITAANSDEKSFELRF